ncbi:ABC transporter permease [Rhodanobacter ginsengiterrae]|uniref:ABC transporter permease n=1 Tax=Rhodanobacter ginsengiterrae TaxID=2008451 RepID=UPI003CFAF703
MFRYYLDLALRSLRHNPVLTGLMVLAIGLGIGASMTMITVLHVMSGDPLPARSTKLFYPTLDPRPLRDAGRDNDNAGGGGVHDSAVDNFTYVDALALLNARRAPRQAMMAGGTVLIQSADDRDDRRPDYESVQYTSADFFAMFGVPMTDGHAWNAKEDEDRARVTVITPSLARRLFDNGPVVGRQIRLGGDLFRVVGETGEWNPQPTFYQDVDSGRPYGNADQAFIPLLTAVDLDLPVNGTSCWGKDNLAGKARRTSGSCSWAQFWVELDDPAQQASYRQFLQGYAETQHAAGRFERAPVSMLYPMMTWLARADWVPGDLRLQLLLALSFLGVCLLNIVALLLAKFLRRSGEISVRRALGARRWDIFLQLGVESMLIGLLGGVLGLVVAQLGLWSVRKRPDAYASLAHMDIGMLLLTLLLALVASLLAGLLPAWRACRVAPALQLKSA